MEREGQKWVLDRLVRLGGMDMLFEDVKPGWMEYGYKLPEWDRTMKRVKCMDMLGPSWSKTGSQLESLGLEAERKGHYRTAMEFYHRASIYYGRATWSRQKENDKKREEYNIKVNKCYDKVIKYCDYPIERVKICLDNNYVSGLLHLPKNKKPEGVILFCPGMDMVKEEFPNVINNVVTHRELAILSIDGPGQGDSLTRGIKVTLDNYDKAGLAAIDYLISRPDINSNNIVVMGISMGSYWAPHIAAAAGDRVRACVAMIATYMQKESIFKIAQPSFRKNFMFMSGVYNDDEFDAMASQMTLANVAKNISCETLLVAGEYDPLCPAEDTYELFDMLECPKELWLYENEFHALGGRRAECLPMAIDWIKDAIINKHPKDLSKKVFINEWP